MLSETDIFTLGFTAAVHTALQTLVTKISFVGVDFTLNSMRFTQWCPQRHYFRQHCAQEDRVVVIKTCHFSLSREDICLGTL